MALQLMGKKRGMMQLFDDQGNVVVCTVIEAEPNVVTQVKTKETDGYEAIQVGFEKVKAKDPRRLELRSRKPQMGSFRKNNVEPRRYLSECKPTKTDDYKVGQEIGVSAFEAGQLIDATATSKGKGFQGVMKLHNFAGGPGAHGSGFHRHAGSTGMRTTPGRCFPGGKRASRMGFDTVTVQNLKVILINPEENLIMIAGAVPGPCGGLVYLSEAKKQRKNKPSGVKLWQQQ